MRPWTKLIAAMLAGGLALSLAQAADDTTDESALVTYQTLSPEVAQKLAQATLEACRKAGYQVAVSVVDRSGIPQVLIRDRYAGAHTPDTSTRKAWTAVSFRTDTLTLSDVTQPGKLQSGVRNVTHAMMIGGGVPIEVAGSLVGGVGVSGAPDGKLDDDCARAGLAAIEGDLAF